MSRLFISAAHKSSGKTTLTIGLCAAFRARGLSVQPFKKGPDYIDPLWLGAAAGRVCRNLDHHTMTAREIARYQRRHAAGADLAVIEGNKGLHDGMARDGGDSSAALARLLRAPVVLVIDTVGITRGIAPLLLGYRAFDPRVTIAGVILNKVGGARHEAKLRQAVEHYTGMPVLGAVQRSPELEISERHLGLIPANELAARERVIAAIAGAVTAQVDLDRLLAVAGQAPALPAPRSDPAPRWRPGGRVGIARDSAFGFYYADDLEALEAEGFTLVPFDATRDPRLPPDLDGLFIGGGFPETHMEALEANGALRADIRRAVERGLPVYAECGGLMYLSRSISWHGRTCAMVGAVAADAVMHDRPQGRGNVRLRETGAAPWSRPAGPGATIAGHEFHYAGLENLAPDTRFAYQVERGHGIDGRHDGIVVNNLLASFSHLRAVGPAPWTRRFAALMRVAAPHPYAPAFEPGAKPCPNARPSMPAAPFAPAL